MSLRPDADDLHVAPPLVRADDAFLAQLAAVSAASTARDRRRAERHPGMRVAFAAASVAAVVTGGTFTAGTLMDADPTDRPHTPPAERPHDRASADVEEPAHAVEPTAGPQPDTGRPRERSPRAYDDGDGAADRDDDLPGVPHPAGPVRPEDRSGTTDRPDRAATTTPPDTDEAPPQDDPPVDDVAARPPPESPALAAAPDPNDPGTGNPGHPGDDQRSDHPGDDDQRSDDQRSDDQRSDDQRSDDQRSEDQRGDDPGDDGDVGARGTYRAGSAADHRWGSGGRDGRGNGWEHRQHASRSPRGA